MYVCMYIRACFKKEREKNFYLLCGQKANRSSWMIFHHNLQFLVYQKEKQLYILLQLCTNDSWLLRDWHRLEQSPGHSNLYKTWIKASGNAIYFLMHDGLLLVEKALKCDKAKDRQTQGNIF